MSDNVCDNGYEEIDEVDEYNIGEEYQEAEGDYVEEEIYVDPEDQETISVDEEKEDDDEDNYHREEEAEEVVEKDVEEEVEEEEEESVELHGEDDIVFSQDMEPTSTDTVEVENEEVSQDEDQEDEEEEREEDDEEEKEEIEAEEDDKEEKEDSITEVECTLTEEERIEEYTILDSCQRQIDEEQYTLRKLRSIIGHQSEDIERLRKKIAGYTKEAEDRKAIEGMEKLKILKADRERAVEERRISTDALQEVRAKRNEKVRELREKGLKIDPRVTYLIEDKELKLLLKNIRTNLKYNSFATLKYSIEELDDVIFNVANVCDDIDEFLTSHNIKPRDINKLNTKERRVSVLYDKLIKWRQYKVNDPDIRPTDYESFMYDPEDMFSDSDDNSDKDVKKRRPPPPRRKIRAVRGGSSDKSPVVRLKRRYSEGKIRSPIRPPTPPARKSPVRPERRAVRGGSPDEAEADVPEKPKDRPLRAEKGGDANLGPRRDQPIRKRRGEPLNDSSFKRRQMSSSQRRPFKRSSPTRRERPPSPRDERRPSPREDRRNSGPPGRYENAAPLRSQDDRSPRPRTTLLRTPPVKSSTSFENRRSPSPVYRSRKENFQISVRNESYRPRSPVQERSYRHDGVRQDRSPPPRHMNKSPGYRGSRGSGHRGGRGSRRRSGDFDRRQGGSGYRR